MRDHLAKRHVSTAGLSLGLLAVLCLSPSLLGDRVSEAVDGLGAADPGLLWVAGIAFAGMSICGALAWRAALARERLAACRWSTRRPATRSGAASTPIAPAHVGSAVRVALFGRVTNGGCWTVGGAAAAVGVTRVRVARGADRNRQRGRCPPTLATARDRRDRRLAPAPSAVVSQRFSLPARLDQLLAVVQVAGRLTTGSRDRVRLGSGRGCGEGRGCSSGRCRARDRQPAAGGTGRRSGGRARGDSSRSRRATSASRALPSHSRSALRGSSRRRRCRQGSRSAPSSC